MHSRTKKSRHTQNSPVYVAAISGKLPRLDRSPNRKSVVYARHYAESGGPYGGDRLGYDIYRGFKGKAHVNAWCASALAASLAVPEKSGFPAKTDAWVSSVSDAGGALAYAIQPGPGQSQTAISQGTFRYSVFCEDGMLVGGCSMTLRVTSNQLSSDDDEVALCFHSAWHDEPDLSLAIISSGLARAAMDDLVTTLAAINRIRREVAVEPLKTSVTSDGGLFSRACAAEATTKLRLHADWFPEFGDYCLHLETSAKEK